MTAMSCRQVIVIVCSFLTVVSLSTRPAVAEPIPLSVLTGPSIQQVANRPCIIGDPSCHNPDGFPYTLIQPQTPDGTLSSPTYTVAQLRELVGGDTFFVGVELNQAMGQTGGAYTLNQFTLSIDGVTTYSTIAPSLLTPLNSGNGFSDAIIAQFSLAGLSADQKLVFTTNFSGATAGREQYFLAAPAEAAPVPEPATFVLVGSGLAIAALRRRAKR